MLARPRATLALTLAALSIAAGPVHAQDADKPVSETELGACLTQEKEAMKRFSALEVRAEVLRNREQELKATRDSLESEKAVMAKRKSGADDISKYNARIEKFNTDGEQFNQIKESFDKERLAYESWVTQTLKPACSKIQNRPVPTLVIFYACKFDQPNSPFEQVPFCQSLENRVDLAKCVKSAGSKTKATELCGLKP
ncbi:hypothetical protein NQT62_08395 [Limnobacter humi]|uniref:Lysozyme inhibitor LprI N-terminal domain-containing protein n=1 Tax=Limnobacter humi TaxID=1778671 RepID=A0ABT1WG03_9BURK|nr:hypothetical protein [Limnobacter humi]MCQ8896449.1 hypothetical protein [Limnobacter humi]